MVSNANIHATAKMELPVFQPLGSAFVFLDSKGYSVKMVCVLTSYVKIAWELKPGADLDGKRALTVPVPVPPSREEWKSRLLTKSVTSFWVCWAPPHLHEIQAYQMPPPLVCTNLQWTGNCLSQAAQTGYCLLAQAGKVLPPPCWPFLPLGGLAQVWGRSSAHQKMSQWP